VLHLTSELKGRLQRTNPVENPDEHRRMFARLIELESRRAQLQALASGPSDGP
jgi:DNA primase